MNVTVIVPPPFEPVTLEQAQQHLRLDATGSPPSHPDDAMLMRMITSARIQAEQITNRSFVQRTLRLTSSFPMSLPTASMAATVTSEIVQLVGPPLIEVASVSYYDSSNSLIVASSSDYYVTDDQVPQLRFNSAAPSVFGRQDAFSVEYVAGYPPDGSPPMTQADYVANVPKNIVDAILLGVQLLYDELPPERRTALENARFALLSADIVYAIF